jgi:opacity protein-like surface antigen
MKKLIAAIVLLLLLSVIASADEEKNQISIMGGIYAVNESGNLSDYEPGYNDFPVTPGHKSISFGFGYARFISGNVGVELDFRYHLSSKVTVTDAMDQERVEIDTLNNYSVTGNILYKFSAGLVQPYITGGAGMNILRPYAKEFTSDQGSIIIITAPEKTNNLLYNVGAGIIAGNSIALRLDVRYAVVSNIDVKGIQFMGGVAFRF